MSLKPIIICLALIASVFITAQAAETVVPPGTGTLKTAIDGATAGDILLLQTGNYNLDANITVNAGVTIRPLDNTQQPQVVLNGKYLTITNNAAPIAPVTVQALTIIGSGTFRTSSAGEVNILGNNFTDTALTLSGTTGPCYIIGNTAQRSGSATSGFSVATDADCYVAGNTFDGTSTFTAYSGYFVGNRVSSTHTHATTMNIYAAYAIGNEFIRNLDINTPPSGNYNYNAATFNAPQQSGLTGKWPFIANNILRVIGSGTGPVNPSTLSVAAVNLNTSSQLHNNVIDYSQFDWSTQGLQGMIYVRHNSTVQGNIVVNGLNNGMPAISYSNDTERTQSDVSFNDCFNNKTDCGSTDGNLDIDPDFDNNSDYPLGAGSPVIDAGPANEHLADLDGSRNDMGIHGGPHQFSQYSDQLAPAVTAPFVYPVFDEVQTLSGAQIDVSAIGVARFK